MPVLSGGTEDRRGTARGDFSQEHVKPPAIEDLTAAVAKLKGEAGRRDEVFRKSFETEKNQGQVLNRKFDELLKQAKENPEFGKKPREFDLD